LPQNVQKERGLRVCRGRPGGRTRPPGGLAQRDRLDLGGQNVPVLVANAFAISSRDSLWVVSTDFAFNAPRRACAMAFAIAKIAHVITSSSANGKIGACLADPFANARVRREIDTFTIP